MKIVASIDKECKNLGPVNVTITGLGVPSESQNDLRTIALLSQRRTSPRPLLIHSRITPLWSRQVELTRVVGEHVQVGRGFFTGSMLASNKLKYRFIGYSRRVYGCR